MNITKQSESIIWTNPIPVLNSRHSYFPFACELENGDILATHQMGEAFESVNGTTRLCISHDKGQTFELLPVFYDKSGQEIPTTDSLKATNVGGGRVAMIGYEYERPDPTQPIGNPETGGVQNSYVIFLISNDNGKTWSKPQRVPSTFQGPIEASAALTVLQNGDWVTPITSFVTWEGVRLEPSCGRLLRTNDEGKTWSDDVICMDMGENVSAYEQRLCQLEDSGALVNIAWCEDLVTGESFNNQYTISYDNGQSFEGPFDTGIFGQASSVCSIGEDRLLALHAMRKGTDRPGIYAYVVNLENGKWDIEAEKVIWEPDTPIVKDNSMAAVFAYLKFGQPGAIKLSDESILTTHWTVENGQGKTIAMKLDIK